MLKIGGSVLFKPLEIIYKSSLQSGVFLADWKETNVASIYKKGDKQPAQNYRVISLLPIYGDVLERLINKKARSAKF